MAGPWSSSAQGRTDALLEAATQRFVNVPWKVGGAQHHDHGRLLALGHRTRPDAVHLDQQLRLDPEKSSGAHGDGAAYGQGLEIMRMRASVMLPYRRLASCSLAPPRALQSESISSMKMVLGE